MATVLASSHTATALLVSSDSSFRHRLRQTLTGLRWKVTEACGGAEALALLAAEPASAIILDSWLPDLEVEELVREIHAAYPGCDVISPDGTVADPTVRSPRRGELLYALRKSEDQGAASPIAVAALSDSLSLASKVHPFPAARQTALRTETAAQTGDRPANGHDATQPLPEFLGSHARMMEVSRRIRMIAPRKTSVLVQGPTGTGKELVARAIHRLSPRAQRPFVALNCAAIPEALLEAELFGHTRGAFTGAVQRRVGRMEAAEGGTLFLDEIGEMPLSLQSKLLRFLESGELQRVGENENIRVDVRIVAATHQPLAQRAREGSFRADLFHRLAVFFVTTPALSEHAEDIRDMAQHFLSRLGHTSPVKRFTEQALEALESYTWPGNVRELEHVVERAYILAEDRPSITAQEIEFGTAL